MLVERVWTVPISPQTGFTVLLVWPIARSSKVELIVTISCFCAAQCVCHTEVIVKVKWKLTSTFKLNVHQSGTLSSPFKVTHGFFSSCICFNCRFRVKAAIAEKKKQKRHNKQAKISVQSRLSWNSFLFGFFAFFSLWFSSLVLIV